MQIPNELLVLLQARFNKSNIEQEWQNLSKQEKIKEIEYCIEKCYMDYEENYERSSYLKKQITQIKKYKKQIQQNNK